MFPLVSLSHHGSKVTLATRCYYARSTISWNGPGEFFWADLQLRKMSQINFLCMIKTIGLLWKLCHLSHMMLKLSTFMECVPVICCWSPIVAFWNNYTGRHYMMVIIRVNPFAMCMPHVSLLLFFVCILQLLYCGGLSDECIML